MIQIYKRDHKVCISIEIDAETQKSVEFTCETGNVLFAELLRDTIKAKLDRRIEVIRQIEYTSGRRDSRIKGKKRDWFYSWLTDSKY